MGIGIGDWGLGIGDWGLGPIPNPHKELLKQIIILIYFSYIYNFLNQLLL